MIVVFYEGRKYSFNGKRWADDQNIFVPYKMQAFLKNKAISDGAEELNFINEEVPQIKSAPAKKIKKGTKKPNKISIKIF